MNLLITIQPDKRLIYKAFLWNFILEYLLTFEIFIFLIVVAISVPSGFELKTAILLFVVLSIIVSLGIPWINTNAYYRLITSSEAHFFIDDEKIVTRFKNGESHISWQGIKKVIRNKYGIFLYTASSHTLPFIHKLIDEQKWEQFDSFISSKESQLSSATGGTIHQKRRLKIALIIIVVVATLGIIVRTLTLGGSDVEIAKLFAEKLISSKSITNDMVSHFTPEFLKILEANKWASLNESLTKAIGPVTDVRVKDYNNRHSKIGDTTIGIELQGKNTILYLECLVINTDNKPLLKGCQLYSIDYDVISVLLPEDLEFYKPLNITEMRKKISISE